MAPFTSLPRSVPERWFYRVRENIPALGISSIFEPPTKIAFLTLVRSGEVKLTGTNVALDGGVKRGMTEEGRSGETTVRSKMHLFSGGVTG